MLHKSDEFMKKNMLLSEERLRSAVSVTIPTDVLESLANVASEKEMSGVEALIQFYVGQGLRRDIEELRRKHAAERAKFILGKYSIDPTDFATFD